MALSEISYENHIFSKTYCEVISKLISIKFSPLKTAYYIFSLFIWKQFSELLNLNILNAIFCI